MPAAGNSWRHLGAIGGNCIASGLRIRARGLRRTRTRVVSKTLTGASVSPVDQTGESAASNVAPITAVEGVTSQTLGACRWTIEMTQSAFRHPNAGFTPHLVEKAGAVGPKTLELRISNGLIREELKNSGNGR